MIDERTYNLVKRDMKAGKKQYIIAKKRKLSGQEVTKIKRSDCYADYGGYGDNDADVYHFSPPLPLFEPRSSNTTLDDVLKEIRELKVGVMEIKEYLFNADNVEEVEKDLDSALDVVATVTKLPKNKKDYAG